MRELREGIVGDQSTRGEGGDRWRNVRTVWAR